MDAEALHSEAERRIKEVTIPLFEEQAHLFVDVWPTWKADLSQPGTQLTADQLQLLGQIDTLDRNCSASAAANPLEGFRPSVPLGETLVAHGDAYRAAERAGIEAAQRCAFVLVAGGLGERLGYGGIKVGLRTESTTGCCYLKHYVEAILAIGDRAGRPLPLAIMLSGDTDAPTRALLKKEGNFGMRDEDLTLMVQDKVPSIVDGGGRFALAKDGRSLETKPHGHGDVHALVAAHGLADAWLAAGLERVFFFQDTNAFALRSCVANCGVSAKLDLDYNSSCVARKPGEAIGAICRLDRPAATRARALTLNVEYNQLAPLLASVGEADDPTPSGASRFPGNINQLLIKLGGDDGYAAVLQRTGGAVPEFDYPKLLSSNAKVGFTVLERAAVREYSPVKNATADGAAKVRAGLAGACPATGEADLYAFNCDLLSVGGMDVAPAADVLDVPVDLRPRVCLSPFFGLTEDDFERCVRGGSLGKGASLVVEGRGSVVLEDVHVRAGSALRVTTGPGTNLVVRGLVVDNAGGSLVALTDAELADAAVPEAVRIRGFKYVPREERHLDFREAGDFVVTA
ncbi:hypothetical protein JL720_5295 [Aureococcus anophagefferens]|nr:hypothetical protein JL720_5295 [Aureococcus anophagefferens]